MAADPPDPCDLCGFARPGASTLTDARGHVSLTICAECRPGAVKQLVEDETALRRPFHVGDRVKPTPHGVSRHAVLSYSDRGTVVGFSRNKQGIRIKRDHRKGMVTWHKSFWEHARE